jgi:predicted aspartyl protease
MRVIWSLLAAACTSLLVNSAAQAGGDCALKQLASLSMIGDPSRDVVVEISVAGKPLHFLVDTGGIYSEISQARADAMHFEPHLIRNGYEMYGFEGREGEDYAIVPKLVLAELQLENVAMLIRKVPLGDGVDGILGPDVLARFDLDFDFASKKLNLMAKQHCQGQVVYWTKAPYAAADFDLSKAHILVPVNLDGHAFSAFLDTGATMTGIEETTARSAFGVQETSAGAQVDPNRPADAHHRFTYRFKLLSLGGLGISNPSVVIYRDSMREGYRAAHPGSVALPIYDDSATMEGPKLIVGMNVLSKFHLYVSYQEKKLYLTPASAQ